MAAGQGFKTFVTGEVLTAADTNGYLMQGVNVFANAAARTAAITSPQEGQMSYLKDTNSTEYYDGASWGSVGGGTTLINSGGTTLTGATITLGSIPATFRNLQLVIQNERPATDFIDVRVRFNSDSGANRHATITTYGNVGPTAFNNTYYEVAIGVDNGASNSLMVINFPDYANTTTWKYAESITLVNDYTTPTSWRMARTVGVYNQIAAISSIDIFNSSGNFTSGTAYLYGVK